jgi:hypothetical protein
MAPERQEPQGAPVEEPQLPQNNDHDNDHREEENNEEEEEEGNKAEGEDDEDYTPWSNAKKDETFHDADEIKTFGNEASIPTSRLRDLLNRINITTPPEFRIKRISRPGREEYKASWRSLADPMCSVDTRDQPLGQLAMMQYLTLHGRKSPPTAVDIMMSLGTLSTTCYHRGRKISSRFLGSGTMFPGCLWCITKMCLWR